MQALKGLKGRTLNYGFNLSKANWGLKDVTFRCLLDVYLEGILDK